MEAEIIDSSDDHEARAGVLRYRCGHAPNGAGAGNQHILTKQGEGQSGVDRVAERIKDCRYIPIDPIAMMPDVCHRHGNILRESSGTIDSDAQSIFADRKSVV